MIFLFAIDSLEKDIDDTKDLLVVGEAVEINLIKSPIYFNLPFIEYRDYYNACVEGGDYCFPGCCPRYYVDDYNSNNFQFYFLLKTYIPGFLTVNANSYNNDISMYLLNQSKKVIAYEGYKISKFINPGYYILSAPYKLNTNDGNKLVAGQSPDSTMSFNFNDYNPFFEILKKDQTYYPFTDGNNDGKNDFELAFIPEINIEIKFSPFLTISTILGGIILSIIPILIFKH
ncbi:MAG: hypothetical protein F6K39_08235 [Okeania sp. SIO3B3]|nr:hypothetical protein [Okeania sp. SIO3B3]